MQVLQGRPAEARAVVEFDTVTKAFSDLETVLAHLDAQDTLGDDGRVLMWDLTEGRVSTHATA